MAVPMDPKPHNPYADDATAHNDAQNGPVGNYPASADTRPVVYTKHQSNAGGYSGIPYSEVVVNDGPGTLYDAKNVLNDLRGRPRQYKALLSQLRAANYLGPRSTSMSSIEDAWTRVLKDASALYDRNPAAQNVNVFDFLYARARAEGGTPGSNGPGGGSGSGGGYSGPTYRIDLTNQFDARALVDDALNTYLGRDATAKERQNFWKQLNAAEAANPQVATPKGVAGAVGSGGFNRQQFAEDYAKSQDDYAETQASTTIMDWIKQGIVGDTTKGLM
jgi:hypothetical protein